jgi:hypothetical protein
MNQELINLLNLPEDKRDQQWELEFFDLFPKATVNLVFEQPRQGPDSWPYLFVNTDGETKEPVKNILAWLSEKGIGLALNPNKEMPDYIMPYGMIWFYRETGNFLSDHFQFKGTKFNIEEGKKYFTGEPSLAYIPEYVRKVVREFMQQQGVLTPRVCMLSEDQQYWDLCFSLDSLGNPPSSEHEGIAEALSWFFPAHYSIVLVKEKELGEFFNL